MTAIDYFVGLSFSFLIVWLGTLLVRRLAWRSQLVDRPEQEPERKIHPAAIPLLGGLGIYLAVIILILFFSLINNRLLGGYLLTKHLVGILLGGFWLMLGGYLDDRYRLSPVKQFIFPVLATLTIIASGVGVSYISNPFGSPIQLDGIRFTLFHWNGLPYGITLWSDLFTIVWLLGMMYTTKFLDGLDGLATGIGAIGSMIIFSLSLTKTVAQPETALLAIVFAGACLGFLLWNFHPAKIFLGEGGSVFIGFFLGVLAIISGAKIATALLIMGIPILDVAWVILRRLFWEKRSIISADKKHLHFRLLDAGLSHRQAVVFLYFLTAVFGLTGLFLNGKNKILSLAVLAGCMVILALFVVWRYRHRNKVSRRIDVS